MKIIINLIFVFMATVLMTGCISTNVKGFTDDQHLNYKIKKVAVRAVNTNFHTAALLENSMIEELEDSDVTAHSYTSLFPPTRQRSNEEVNEKLLSMGFDSVMSINLGASKSSSYSDNINIPTGYDSAGNTYSTNMAIHIVRRNTSAKVRVYNVKSEKLVWVGDTYTEAGGLLYMSDESTTDSIAEDVVETLKESGHL
jgi:hypothetical protein